MYRSFVLACLLGVLLKQVYAYNTEKVECMRNLITTELKSWQGKMSKIRSCKELLQRVEDIYEYFEDCSIDGSVMDSLSTQVDEFCAPDSRIFEDMSSGKECWPKTYPLQMFQCASNFLLNLNEQGDEQSCPSLEPLIDCCTNAAEKLCEGKSMKQINRFIAALRGLGIGICNSIFETATA